MKTRRTQVFKESAAHFTLRESRRQCSIPVQEQVEFLINLAADSLDMAPRLHARFWVMVAEEMSQPDAVFLKIV